MIAGKASERGLRGPVLAAVGFFGTLLLAPPVQALGTDLQLDLSGPISLPAYRATLQAMARCEPVSLTIHYAFGDIDLAADSTSTPCQLQISLQGELRENGERDHYVCKLATVELVDWLYENQRLREGPPGAVLRDHRSCKTVTAAELNRPAE